MVVYAYNIADPSHPWTKVAKLSDLLNVVIPLLMTVAGVIFLFMLVSGAFMYLTSGDSAEKVKKAQSTFITAIIGLIIVVSSFMIIKVLGYFFNIQNLLPI
jgi:hypothetical protein